MSFFKGNIIISYLSFSKHTFRFVARACTMEAGIYFSHELVRFTSRRLRYCYACQRRIDNFKRWLTLSNVWDPLHYLPL